jgi:hypothetical protein
LTLEEYYKMDLLRLKENLTSLKGRIAGIIEDPDISTADMKKMARTHGRSEKDMSLVKEVLAT